MLFGLVCVALLVCVICLYVFVVSVLALFVGLLVLVVCVVVWSLFCCVALRLVFVSVHASVSV